MSREFADISFFQGDVNFDVMHQKSDSVIIRAGQNLWVDLKFHGNWSEAKRVKMARGAYWFWDDRIDPGRQAALFASLLKDDKPELGAWCDWEKSFSGAFKGLKNVVAFMQEFERLLPDVEIGFYTGFYWMVENSNLIWNAAQYAYLATKPLWLAWYGGTPKIPAPWNAMHYHQYGTPAVGLEWGCESEDLDMNRNMVGDTDPTPIPDPEEDMTLYGTVIIDKLNIRSGPGTSYEDIGDLLKGDKLEASESLGGWWKLTKVTRGGTSPIINLGYAFANSGLYIRTDAPPDPTPTPAPDKIVLNIRDTGSISIVRDGVTYTGTYDRSITGLECLPE